MVQIQYFVRPDSSSLLIHSPTYLTAYPPIFYHNTLWFKFNTLYVLTLRPYSFTHLFTLSPIYLTGIATVRDDIITGDLGFDPFGVANDPEQFKSMR